MEPRLPCSTLYPLFKFHPLNQGYSMSQCLVRSFTVCPHLLTTSTIIYTIQSFMCYHYPFDSPQRAASAIQPATGGMQKSRMSLGGDPVIAAAAAQATAVPLQTSDKGATWQTKHQHRHCMPYTQRLDLPGATSLLPSACC